MSFLTETKEKEKEEKKPRPKPEPMPEPPKELETEQGVRLKLERELLFIRSLIDKEPKVAYRYATQMRNQIKDYLSQVEGILDKLEDKLDAEGATFKSANEE